MSQDAGVVRDAAGLNRLVDLLDTLGDRCGEAGPLVAARLVAECALARQESRGAHFRADHPLADAEARHTLVSLEAGRLSRKAA